MQVICDQVAMAVERARLIWEPARGAQLELADADRRKDEFLAMLGHELRNPLAPILNALHVAGRRARRPDGRAARAHDDRAAGAPPDRGWSTTCSTSRGSRAARSSCASERGRPAPP